jgi:hypothetical protein
MSIAICEIIQKFYTEYSRNLDIIDFGGSHDELITEIMKNINNSMAVTVQKRKYWKTWLHTKRSQSIYLFNNFQDLSHFNDMKLIDVQFLNPTKIIGYYPNASEFDLATLDTMLAIIPLYYFIVPGHSYENLKLFTFDNNKLYPQCIETFDLYEVNEFSVKDRKWLKDPIFPKKFQNFHGCIMGIGFYNFTNLFFTSVVDDKPVVNHFVVDLTTAIAKHLNFHPNLITCFKPNCAEQTFDQTYLYNILVSETLDGSAVASNGNYRWLHSFMNVECR